MSPAAQHGESLLWSSWQDKHPEKHSGEGASAPWDDAKLDWEAHVAETYYSYWEQYTYWVGQGWTMDESVSTNGGAASAVTDRSSETSPQEQRGVVECPQGDGVNAPRDEVEGLNHLFGENCTLEPSETRVCGSDSPQDGGNGPATSSQHSTPAQPGEL